MAFRVSVSELGIAGDDRVFEGSTPGDVLDQLVPYLKKEHGIDLPDAGDLLGPGGALAVPTQGGGAGAPDTRGIVVTAPIVGGDEDAGTNLILTRLYEKLNLRDSGLHADSDTDPTATAG